MENGERIKMIKDIATLNAEVSFIKTQVSNHLPTAISTLDTKIEKYHKEVGGRLRSIELKMAYWSGAIVIVLGVLQFIINKFF